MRDGKFTEAEREYLMSLDAVDDVRGGSIHYSDRFRIEAMARYRSGERPKAIFESAGLLVEMVGYKRIERSFARWRENDLEDILARNLDASAPDRESARSHRRGRKPVKKPAGSRDGGAEGLLREKDETIAYQAREIERLKMEVEALKGLRRLEMRLAAEERTPSKSDEFALVQQLHQDNPRSSVAHLCGVLGVSRSGFYRWCATEEARASREEHDLELRDLVMEAFSARGFRKGSRQIREWILAHKGVRVNRKRIQRIMRKYGITCPVRRRNPYAGMHADGDPKYMPNLLSREFFPGVTGRVFITDITYVPVADAPWLYLSAIKDSETGEVVAWKCSRSLAMPFVMDCLDQLGEHGFAPGAMIHSDAGVHYTSHQYHDRVKEMGLVQSMSRVGNCHDNACIESFFGRMKQEIGRTDKLTFAQAEALIADYVDYYNNERCQRRLGGISPAAYAKKLEGLAA